MPIRKPSTHSNDSVNTVSTHGIDTVNDKAAEKFINGPRAINKSDKPRRKAKVQMMMRIDEDLLADIDLKAAEEGISRSAWISQSCALRLKGNL